MIIRSRKIYTEHGVVDGCMTVEKGRIVKILEGECAGARDIGELRVIPGVFDTHNHGVQGFSLVEDIGDTIEDNIRGYIKGAAAEGVTSVFPTLYSGPAVDDRILDIISVIAGFVGVRGNGATVEGIHFEGPYLNRVGEKGVRTEPLKIDLAYIQKMLDASHGTFKLMGHAPELPDSDKLERFLLDNGVTVAFTHTDCNAAQAFAAFDRGVTVATHLCNVMVGVHHRDVGGLGASLLDDRVYCELICDGLHVCDDMLKLILRAKPHDRVMMISDCVGFDGAPTGVYMSLSEKEGGERIIVDSEGLIRDPGGRLRGSSKPVLYGVRNLVENVGLSMEEVVPLFSLNPCRKYGIADRKGSLAAGKDADFVIIDDAYEPIETYVGGQKVYDRAAESGKIFNPRMIEKCKVE